MWIRYAIIYQISLLMCPPLMGSLGRLVGASLGKAVFFKNHTIKTALKPPRGRPFGGGGVHRIFWGMGASASIFVILLLHALHTKKLQIAIFSLCSCHLVARKEVL
jgi:hypothetical protein